MQDSHTGAPTFTSTRLLGTWNSAYPGKNIPAESSNQVGTESSTHGTMCAWADLHQVHTWKLKSEGLHAAGLRQKPSWPYQGNRPEQVRKRAILGACLSCAPLASG